MKYSSAIIDVKLRREDEDDCRKVTGFDIVEERKYSNGKIIQYTYHNTSNPFTWPQIHRSGRDVQINFDLVPICYGDSNVILEEQIIREPDPLEVTMDDIEAKFGQKVKIINE